MALHRSSKIPVLANWTMKTPSVMSLVLPDSVALPIKMQSYIMTILKAKLIMIMMYETP